MTPISISCKKSIFVGSMGEGAITKLLTEEVFQASLKQLELSLRILCDAGRVKLKETNCDGIKAEFRTFKETVLSGNSEPFCTFDPSEDRVDELLHEHLSNHKEFPLLWYVVLQLLILSHGQATVERGFSINKETLIENLSKRSLVARCLVVDAVRRAGGPEKLPVTSEIPTYASSARRNYHAYLDEEKEKKAAQVMSQKRKAEVEEVEQLKAKRQQLEKDIAGLEASAKAKAEEAEKQSVWDLLIQSNALRRRADEKKEELTRMDKAIAEKEEELTRMDSH